MSAGDLALGPGVEFDMIRAMRERWGALARDLGDDAATLCLPRGDRLVASTDTALEDVHFRRTWLTPREIACRSVTAALSDLAAMAATPRGVLVAIQLPESARDDLAALADGIGDAVRAADTVILGGNLARGAELGITTTVLGSAYAPLTRGGAAAGDTVYVTGALGGPAAALRAWSAGATPAARERERFVRPTARIREAEWLAARGATAAIDISDGLAADAGHLAAASRVALEIDAGRVPVLDGATVDDALAGGDEYELVVTVRDALDTAEFSARFGVALTAIGRVSRGEPGVVLRRGGRRVAAPGGHDHFSR